jgi:hypothetical protein
MSVMQITLFRYAEADAVGKIIHDGAQANFLLEHLIGQRLGQFHPPGRCSVQRVEK